VELLGIEVNHGFVYGSIEELDVDFER